MHVGKSCVHVSKCGVTCCVHVGGCCVHVGRCGVHEGMCGGGGRRGFGGGGVSSGRRGMRSGERGLRWGVLFFRCGGSVRHDEGRTTVLGLAISCAALRCSASVDLL